MTLSTLFCILALSILAPAVSAQDAATLIVTFLDANGAPVGQTLTITKRKCLNLDTSSIPGGAYASIKTSDPRAGLNLYQSEYCQALTNSAVGEWPNTGTALDTKSFRWEGTAPSSRKTGSLTTNPFPPGMAVQTQVANLWVMDPTKGILVVIVVAVVMVIGVAIGIYQVYKAAQYVPPPKKPKKVGLDTKKIKKKDAYFKKPARDDQQSFQRLHNESPEPFNTRQSMVERSRDSQYSEAATTFVDWNNSNNNTGSNQKSLFNNSRNGQYSDSISIDMRETGRGNSSSQADLIQLDNHVPNHQNSQRGRGGEVLVPMHTLDNNYHNQHQGRSTVRRLSSSRSR
ncbi:hypothetical protein BG011_001764 [Mortierella polycephala]|uniref:Uncharacterized protein n=1 Tax=Mortierella polycephala TaxID=41804 RepID=A0A9P6QH82_9FUNG|nr:hypothetical protein BG011_001764 [Mortierella polycephala]